MVFKCLLGAAHLNATSSKPARSWHHQAAPPGVPGSTWNASALPTGAGRAAAQRPGGRALCPSPSPPALSQSSGGISPSRGSPGRAGGVEQRACTHHPVCLWQLLLSNPDRATTGAWRQILSRRARGLWRRARSDRTARLPAGQVPVPCPAWESAMRSSSLAGQSGRRLCCSKVSSKDCHRRGLVELGTALHLGQSRSPRSLLSSSLQPDVGKCWVSVPALSSLLLPTFAAADLSRALSLSATCPGAPSKATWRKQLPGKEQGGRKGTDGVGRARRRRESLHPVAGGEGRRMFCNIWRALPRAERGKQRAHGAG